MSRYRSTIIFGSIALLLVADLWLALAHPLAFVPVATTERGEVFNATASIQEEIKQGGSPYVLLLGSSLMVAPVVQAEASELNRPVKRFFERRSSLLEKLINEPYPGETLGADGRSQERVSVYNMAVGGEMGSDAYLIARHFLKSGNPPVAIIYGVSPRDFQDNLMPGVASSQTFQVMGELSDIPEIARLENLSWETTSDAALGRVWRLWRSRADLKLYLGLMSKKWLERACPFIVFEKYGETLELKAQRRGQFPEEARGTPLAYPGYAIDHSDGEATRNRYLRSYNPVNERMVDTQFTYFDKFLRLANSSNVSVLVVNMPLSMQNKALLQKGFYGEYLDRVKRLCAAGDVEFRDYNNSLWDKNSNFVDTVHLTSRASKPFLRDLARCVQSSSLSIAFAGERRRRHAGSRSDRPL